MVSVKSKPAPRKLCWVSESSGMDFWKYRCSPHFMRVWLGHSEMRLRCSNLESFVQGNSDAHQSLEFTWWFGFFAFQNLALVTVGSYLNHSFPSKSWLASCCSHTFLSPDPTGKSVLSVHATSTQWPQRAQPPLRGRKRMPTSVF